MAKGAVVWITRTAEGGKRTARAIMDMGHDAIVAPVLKVVFLKPLFDPHSFDAVIVTSCNGLDAFCALCGRRAIPVYCVGDSTAEAAREKRFQRVVSAEGNVAALHALIRGGVDRATRLLYAAPAEPSFDLTAALRGDGFHVREAAVYETRAVTPALLPADLHRLTHVLIHSAKGGRATAGFLKDKSGYDVTFLCISEAAWRGFADAMPGSAHMRHEIANFPGEDSLLMLLNRQDQGTRT